MAMLTDADRVAILAIYGEYNRAIDSGDVAAWVETWTSDGVFGHPSRKYTGALELRGFVTSRGDAIGAHPVEEQRHWNAEIEIGDSPGGAFGRCLLLVAGVERTSSRPTVVARGHYEDVLVCVRGNWRFARRYLVLTYPA
jgi:hypothetical protein